MMFFRKPVRRGSAMVVSLNADMVNGGGLQGWNEIVIDIVEPGKTVTVSGPCVIVRGARLDDKLKLNIPPEKKQPEDNAPQKEGVKEVMDHINELRGDYGVTEFEEDDELEEGSTF